MSTCNWVDLETLGPRPIDCAQKSPRTLCFKPVGYMLTFLGFFLYE